jgi:hypothetical protein
VLYDEDGTEVASKAPSADGHANFDTFNYTFPADEATSLFIGVVAKSINAEGDAAGTATFNRGVKFTLANATQLGDLNLSANEAVTAIGEDSGEDIDCDEDDNGAVAAGDYAYWGDATTTEATITGSVLNSIVNDMSDGTLTAGSGRTIGKYKFVFDNGSNRATTTNEELKAQLVELKITVATSSTVVTNVKAYIDGSPSNKTSAATPGAGGVHTLNLDEAGKLADSALVDGTITLIIVGDVSAAPTNSYVQTRIADLDGQGDFTYNGNNNYMVDFDDVKLDIVEVLGATLSN